MAGRSSVAKAKSKAKSDLLEARVAELEKLVAEMHARVMGCGDAPRSEDRSASGKTLRSALGGVGAVFGLRDDS